MHMVLKRMGISNNLFPLALYQPELSHIDPHNLTDTSKELRLRIATECKINPWYAFREVLRAPASGGDTIPFIANRGLMAMIWCFFNNVSYISIQPRQTGKAQPLYSKIKTPTGWTSMGDITLGDKVTVPDGKTISVIGVYPQGAKSIYRVTLDDGRYTDSCEEHLWKVYDRLLYPAGGIISLKEIIQHDIFNISVPVVDSEIKSTTNLRIRSIEYVGQHEAQCIEVDHPDHLYITDNFIVTHNTIGACGIVTLILYIMGKEIEISLFTKDSQLVHDNVGRIKTMRDALPEYIVHTQISDTDNKEGLSYTALRNKYKTAIAQKDKLQADIKGRGSSSPVNHFDEPGYCTNIDITYPVMMLATTAAIENARVRGQPHSNILTTTAAPIDTVRGKYTYNLVNRAMVFTEKLYDLRDNTELHAIVRANSANGLINGTFSYLMLGKTREWYENACRISEAPKDVTDRELLNKWISGTDTGILDPEIIEIINANKHEPNHVEIIQDYVVRWYITESFLRSTDFFRKKYVLGMDSSENIGEDFTTLVMIDVSDMAVVCTFRCNESNTIKMGMFIAEFLIKYSNVTFVPERNSTGGAIIDVVTMVFQKHRINPFRRIFNYIVQNRSDPTMARISIDDPDVSDTTIKKHLGFRTTGKTRPYLYKNTLKKAVSINSTRIYDSTLVSELSALSTVNGRIDHTDGGHDDMVISYLLCCWFIFFGENLNLYGIDVRSILTSVTSEGEVVDPTVRDRQLEIHRSIKYYEDLINKTTSIVLRNTYKQKILLLQNELDPTVSVVPIGIDKISKDANDYGNNLYTPQAINSIPKYDANAERNLRQLLQIIR